MQSYSTGTYQLCWRWGLRRWGPDPSGPSHLGSGGYHAEHSVCPFFLKRGSRHTSLQHQSLLVDAHMLLTLPDTIKRQNRMGEIIHLNEEEQGEDDLVVLLHNTFKLYFIYAKCCGVISMVMHWSEQAWYLNNYNTNYWESKKNFNKAFFCNHIAYTHTRWLYSQLGRLYVFL